MSSLLSCNMSQQGLSPQLMADESWAFLKQAILENLPVIRKNLHGHVQLRRHMPGVAVPHPFGHGELDALHHPALATIARLRLPQAWTVCGGPAYVRAAKSLSAQLHARR